jgi:hypothetical protein
LDGGGEYVQTFGRSKGSGFLLVSFAMFHVSSSPKPFLFCQTSVGLYNLCQPYGGIPLSPVRLYHYSLPILLFPWGRYSPFLLSNNLGASIKTAGSVGWRLVEHLWGGKILVPNLGFSLVSSASISGPLSKCYHGIPARLSPHRPPLICMWTLRITLPQIPTPFPGTRVRGSGG